MAAVIPGQDELARLIRTASQAAGRHLDVAGTLNFRDAGGYPVAGGAQVRWRTLLRSDALDQLGPGALEQFASLGLRTVVDLRTAEEAALAPGPAAGLARLGAVTTSISLLGEVTQDLRPELGAIYDFIVDRRGAEIATAISALARPGGLPALVHCSAGKDRTGIVIGLVLAAVGVPDEVVAADYALTGLYLDPRHTPVIGRLSQSTGLGDDTVTALLACPPELMLGLLGRVRRHGGSIEGYLAGHGVSPADLAALRAALVTGGEPEPDGP
ncbi:MAG TPA: tyrosine-protein phosphatase [Streptosporangiaceae bacterium]